MLPHPLLVAFALVYAVAIACALLLTGQSAPYLLHITLLVAGLAVLSRMVERPRR